MPVSGQCMTEASKRCNSDLHQMYDMFEGLESWGRAFATVRLINEMAISSFDS